MPVDNRGCLWTRPEERRSRTNLQAVHRLCSSLWTSLPPGRKGREAGARDSFKDLSSQNRRQLQAKAMGKERCGPVVRQDTGLRRPSSMAQLAARWGADAAPARSQATLPAASERG